MEESNKKHCNTDLEASLQKDKVVDYEKAGVSYDYAEKLIDTIKEETSKVHFPGVMGSIGGFGALFDISAIGIDDPILVSSADGVGTKIKLALEADKLDEIGADLVAMCVNDILCLGAKPLFFLDYFATSSLDFERSQIIMKSIAKSCTEAGCALIGGETAQMPDMYKGNDFDLAGFCIGAVSRKNILPVPCSEGDKIIGLFSSGLHSNGFSLVRRILEGKDLNAPPPFFSNHDTLAEACLAPTTIYVSTIIDALKTGAIKAIAHITGGGITGNVCRVIGKEMSANIDLSAWDIPEIFLWLKKSSGIDTNKMLDTFNCGIGMTLICSSSDVEKVTQSLSLSGIAFREIGYISKKVRIDDPAVIYQ